MTYVFKWMETPVGRLKLVAGDKGLVAILWPNDNPKRVPLSTLTEAVENPYLIQAEQELTEYFAGKRSEFTVPLDFKGTDFQQSVWRALLTIPFGETRSYGQIAMQLDKPSASRAVGAANGKNPISIIAPCHRVIGTNGTLTGFAGGLGTKAHLLALEGHADSRQSELF